MQMNCCRESSISKCNYHLPTEISKRGEANHKVLNDMVFQLERQVLNILTSRRLGHVGKWSISGCSAQRFPAASVICDFEQDTSSVLPRSTQL